MWTIMSLKVVVLKSDPRQFMRFSSTLPTEANVSGRLLTRLGEAVGVDMN